MHAIDPSTSYLKFSTSPPWFIYDRNSPEERRWKSTSNLHASVLQLYLQTFSLFASYICFRIFTYLKQSASWSVEASMFDRRPYWSQGGPQWWTAPSHYNTCLSTGGGPRHEIQPIMCIPSVGSEPTHINHNHTRHLLSSGLRTRKAPFTAIIKEGILANACPVPIPGV